MATKLKNYSTTAGSNSSAPPNGWPEGMNPSDVNNAAREMMARLAEWYIDAEWILQNDTVTGFTASTITITGDVTAKYVADRAIRLDESNSKMAIITGSVFAAGSTTVTVTGYTIVGSPTSIELGIISLTKSGLVTIYGAQTIVGDKTFTGKVDLTAAPLQGGTPLVFEGATDDAFEQSIAVEDPVADKTVTIPNATGTVPLVVDKVTATTEVVNSAAETTVYSKNIVAGTLLTSRALRLSIIADYYNETGSTRTLTLKVKFGSTTVMNVSWSGLASSANRRSQMLQFELHAKGATNAQVAHGVLTQDGGAGVQEVEATASTFGDRGISSGHNAITEDTTSDKTLEVTVQHSGASAFASFKMLSARLELLP